MVNKLASAIYNDIVSGLAGISSNPTISLAQLEDDIIDERLQIIKEYSLKNLIPKKDLLMSINCIDVDCLSLDKCPCNTSYSEARAHFQLPQLVSGFSTSPIEYLGSIDKSLEYKVYTSTAFNFHKYLRRGAAKPFVYIDITPNENNYIDGWIFNAPFTKKISAQLIPKDPRQLSEYSCCADDDMENYSYLSAEIKKRLTEKKIRYYRQFMVVPTPNNQVAK